MKRDYRRLFYCIGLSLLCVLTGCKKETVYQVRATSTLEQPFTDDTTAAKTYLHSNESWIYWEDEDMIAVYAGTGVDSTNMWLIGGAHTNTEAEFRGRVITTEQESIVYAVYPESAGNAAQWDGKLCFPATQPYRTTTNPIPDQSFGRGCLPMVAWTSTNWEDLGEEAMVLDFHSVAGLLRLQFYSTAGEEATIQKIEFSSIAAGSITRKQISGSFTINDIRQNAPYLTGTSVTDASSKITITGINQTVGGAVSGTSGVPADDAALLSDSVASSQHLWTFYLALPALHHSNITQYALEVKITSDKGTYTKKLKADMGRNRITKMPAINISAWDVTTTGSTDVNLVGSGTQQRPYQIYTAEELMMVREAFKTAYNSHVNNNVMGRDDCQGTAVAHDAAIINGQRVTKNTYFQVMRTDIMLTPQNWVDGIVDFVGHFSVGTGNPTQHGLYNISGYPLFRSITEDGDVSFVTISNPPITKPASCECTDAEYAQMVARLDGESNGQISYYYTGTPGGLSGSRFRRDTTYSPLCYANWGTIRDCHNRMNIVLKPLTTSSSSVPGNVAAICVHNYGTGRIQGGGNEAVISAGVRASRTIGGGVSKYWVPFGHENSGYGVYRHIAGVCEYNHAGGTVEGFTFSASTLNADSVAGICYVNEGTVSDCQGAFRAYQSPSNWGVIVFYNQEGAKIENCDVSAFVWTDTVMVSGQPVNATNIGGISYFNRGLINHCRNNANLRGNHTAGIVMRQDGANAVVVNCWSSRDATVRGNDIVAGIVGRLWRGQVLNCYSRSTIRIASEDNTARSGGIAAEVGTTAVINNCYNRYASFYGKVVEVPANNNPADLILIVDPTLSTRSAESDHWYTMNTAAYKKFEELCGQNRVYISSAAHAIGTRYTYHTFAAEGYISARGAVVYTDATGATLPTVDDSDPSDVDYIGKQDLLVNRLNYVVSNSLLPTISGVTYDDWYLGSSSYVEDGVTVMTYDSIPMLGFQRGNSWTYEEPAGKALRRERPARLNAAATRPGIAARRHGNTAAKTAR